MNAGTCWEQEYNRPNGLSVEKAPKSDLYLYLFRDGEGVILVKRLWNTLYTILLTDDEINTELYTVSHTTNRVIPPIINVL